MLKKTMMMLTMTLLVVVSCWAQVDQIHYREEATLTWDAVSTTADGQPLLDTDVVEYDAYLYDSRLSIDDQNIAELTSLGRTESTEILIDFANKPRAMYYAGVRVVVTDGTGSITESQIAWSYDPEVTAESPFAYIPLGGVLVLPLPSGLRDSGM